MERVAKFFIPLLQTGTTSNASAGPSSFISAPYRLPPGFFPLPSNQSARFTLLNIAIAPVGGIVAQFIAAQVLALASGNPTSYIASFPGFPLAASAVIQQAATPPATSPTLVLPVVNAGWEWDSFVTTGSQPTFLAVRAAVNATTAGGVWAAFEGILEIWRM